MQHFRNNHGIEYVKPMPHFFYSTTSLTQFSALFARLANPENAIACAVSTSETQFLQGNGFVIIAQH